MPFFSYKQFILEIYIFFTSKFLFLRQIRITARYRSSNMYKKDYFELLGINLCILYFFWRASNNEAQHKQSKRSVDINGISRLIARGSEPRKKSNRPEIRHTGRKWAFTIYFSRVLMNFPRIIGNFRPTHASWWKSLNMGIYFSGIGWQDKKKGKIA